MFISFKNYRDKGSKSFNMKYKSSEKINLSRPVCFGVDDFEAQHGVAFVGFDEDVQFVYKFVGDAVERE